MPHRRQCKLSPAARRDLEDIWRYSFEKWSAAQADHYIGLFTAAFASLARGTATGRDMSAVRSGYLRLTVGSHFIFYTQTEADIVVVRILHQRMDIAAHL